MPRKHPEQDRIFDGLSSRFRRNIYSTLKGQLRLAVLQRDFECLGSLVDQQVLDVGAGQGQFALWVAAQGADVTLTDISVEMLAAARKDCEQVEFRHPPTVVHSDLWALPEIIAERSYDIVISHAVLEWLEKPLDAIACLSQRVKPGGCLSLLFYNVHGLVFKNLLRTNYQKVKAKDFRGQNGSFTPLNPLEPSEILRRVNSLGLDVLCHSGVRVFHDYLLDREKRAVDRDSVLEIELEYSRKDPYRGLGRYVHLLLKKPN